MEAEEPGDAKGAEYTLKHGKLVGKGKWDLVECQDMHLQGCILNLNKTSPNATTKPIWVKGPEFHSIIRFL